METRQRTRLCIQVDNGAQCAQAGDRSAVNIRYEMALRPEALRWPDWIRAQIGKIERALDALERDCQGFDDRITMAQIAFGAALGYLDFRFADIWTGARPAPR